MILFRQAKTTDLESIFRLAELSGVGFTSLPEDLNFLQKHLLLSVNSFTTKSTAPTNEYYLFVLEDLSTKEVVGTSAIRAATGFNYPFFVYKISTHSQSSNIIDIQNKYQILNLVEDYTNKSELCTLYLKPEYRFNCNGILLSRARFLFIKSHPKRFQNEFMSEIRGYIDENNKSPFWDALGKKFFKIPFYAADRLRAIKDNKFIEDLIPKNPIYINLLNKKAQKVIAMPHIASLPAMRILEREGFYFNQYIDIFDGGPLMETTYSQINTIKNSKKLKVKKILNNNLNGHHGIITNTDIDFKALVGPIIINDDENTCNINAETAKALNIEAGNFINFALLKAK